MAFGGNDAVDSTAVIKLYDFIILLRIKYSAFFTAEGPIAPSCIRNGKCFMIPARINWPKNLVFAQWTSVLRHQAGMLSYQREHIAWSGYDCSSNPGGACHLPSVQK